MLPPSPTSIGSEADAAGAAFCAGAGGSSRGLTMDAPSSAAAAVAADTTSAASGRREVPVGVVASPLG